MIAVPITFFFSFCTDENCSLHYLRWKNPQSKWLSVSYPSYSEVAYMSDKFAKPMPYSLHSTQVCHESWNLPKGPKPTKAATQMSTANAQGGKKILNLKFFLKDTNTFPDSEYLINNDKANSNLTINQQRITPINKIHYYKGNTLPV